MIAECNQRSEKDGEIGGECELTSASEGVPLVVATVASTGDHDRDDLGSDAAWMGIALAEADAAAAVGEVPVGCVIVGPDGSEWSRGANRREETEDPTAHAEVVALRDASRHRGTWRLEGATVYVTLEPCVMCAGALVHARVARVVYGCDDPKGGALTSLYSIGQDGRLNHRFAVVSGVRRDACAERLGKFFAALRAQRKK